MSFKAFESVVKAYDGRSTDDSIRFASGVTRERILYGAGAPRRVQVPDSHFYELSPMDTLSNLVGIWRVGEADGTEAYHVVRSDTRPDSGVNIRRYEPSEIELQDGAYILRGSVEREDIVIPQSDHVATIGGMAIVPMVEVIDSHTA